MHAGSKGQVIGCLGELVSRLREQHVQRSWYGSESDGAGTTSRRPLWLEQNEWGEGGAVFRGMGSWGLLALKRRWWGLQLLFWVSWEATREYSGFYFYWEAVHINMPLLSCFSRVQLFGRFGLQPTRLLCLWNSSGKNAVVGCRFLPQGSFLTEGWNPDLLCLTCIVRRVLYH